MISTECLTFRKTTKNDVTDMHIDLLRGTKTRKEAAKENTARAASWKCKHYFTFISSKTKNSVVRCRLREGNNSSAVHEFVLWDVQFAFRKQIFICVKKAEAN